MPNLGVHCTPAASQGRIHMESNKTPLPWPHTKFRSNRHVVWDEKMFLWLLPKWGAPAWASLPGVNRIADHNLTFGHAPEARIFGSVQSDR